MKAIANKPLVHFFVTADMEATDAPESWPHKVIAGDAGSDNLADIQFAQRGLRCNLDYMHDRSQGLSRGLEAALTASGFYAHQKLCWVAWKVGHSPWADNSRYVAVKECITERLLSGGFG